MEIKIFLKEKILLLYLSDCVIIFLPSLQLSRMLKNRCRQNNSYNVEVFVSEQKFRIKIGKIWQRFNLDIFILRLNGNFVIFRFRDHLVRKNDF